MLRDAEIRATDFIDTAADYLTSDEKLSEENNKFSMKENDEMLVLKSIRDYKQNGGCIFEDLKKNRNNPPELLLKEMKRLNLIRLKYL